MKGGEIMAVEKFVDSGVINRPATEALHAETQAFAGMVVFTKGGHKVEATNSAQALGNVAQDRTSGDAWQHGPHLNNGNEGASTVIGTGNPGYTYGDGTDNSKIPDGAEGGQ